MKANSLQGVWGCIHDPGQVLENSRRFFNREHLSGATMRCKSNDDSMVILDFKGASICARRGAFDRRRTPDFAWGDEVLVLSKRLIGQVEEICWHYMENRYFYLISHDGKLLKKRYHKEDLKRI